MSEGPAPFPENAEPGPAAGDADPGAAIVEETIARERGGLVHRLLPWVITAGIFYYIFRQIDLPDVVTAAAGANLRAFALTYLAFAALNSLLWMTGMYLVYTWWHCRVTPFEVLTFQQGGQLLTAVVPGFGSIAGLLYLSLRRGQSMLKVFATQSFVYQFINNFGYFFLVICLAPFVETEYGPLLFAAACILFTPFLLHLVFWRRGMHFGIAPQSRGWVYFRPYRKARLTHYAIIMAINVVAMGVYGVMNAALLTTFDVRVPNPDLIIAAPFLQGAGFIPMASAGGYGLPQLLWMEFFGGYTTLETIFAYSILLTTANLCWRVSIGALFFRRFWGWLVTPGVRGPGGVLLPDSGLQPAVSPDDDAPSDLDRFRAVQWSSYLRDVAPHSLGRLMKRAAVWCALPWAAPAVYRYLQRCDDRPPDAAMPMSHAIAEYVGTAVGFLAMLLLLGAAMYAATLVSAHPGYIVAGLLIAANSIAALWQVAQRDRA